MRKRNITSTCDEEPPSKKPSYASSHTSHLNIEPGEVLKDRTGKEWKLGKAIGLGAFGEIYLASHNTKGNVKNDCEYVAKIESYTNGPLFVEINCYIRVAKENMINEWKINNKIESLGMPHYIASGSHTVKGSKYRFLIIPRYKKDVQELLVRQNEKFNLKTVLTMSIQLFDILSYIHSNGFIHADIKASNMLIEDKESDEEGKIVLRKRCTSSKRNLRSKTKINYSEDIIASKMPEKTNSSPLHDQVYLLDYGLASKYLLSNGQHRTFCSDQRRAHAGTILFCSLDAHKGALSRRSDLESLGYNIIYWLTSSLPWKNNIEDVEIVQKKKQQCISELEYFLAFCFGGQCPKFLLQYFKYVKSLNFTSEPNYEKLKKLFKNALQYYGYKDDNKFDFENNEGWGCKQKIKKKKNSENSMIRRRIAYAINRTPLKSNLPIKPVLRKEIKIKNLSVLNWSRILMKSENLLRRKAKERKLTESSASVESTHNLSNINITELNPTPAMLDIYNNYIDKSKYDGENLPKHKGDANSNNMDGYTSAMIQVYNRMMEARELELAKLVVKNNNRTKIVKSVKPKSQISMPNIRKGLRSSSRSLVKEKPETRRRKSTPYRLRG